MTNKQAQIIMFDGVCNLCNSMVQFTIKRDREEKFKFASLQSAGGQALLKKFGLSTRDFHSFVLISGDNYFLRSTAALRVLKELGGIWRLLYIFIIIPRPIRDFFYRIIAGNRYALFGKRDSCMIPTPKLQQRFLQ